MEDKLKALDKLFDSANMSRFRHKKRMGQDEMPMEEEGLMTIKIITNDPEMVKERLGDLMPSMEGENETYAVEEEEDEEEYPKKKMSIQDLM